MTAIAIAIRNKQALAWWQWVKLIGAIGLVMLLVALAIGVNVPSLVIGLIVHLACDFTFQSGETAARKGERKRHLTIHSLIAGGLVGLLTGLSVGLMTGMAGLLIGGLSHYTIDYTRKFGLSNWKLAIALDQAAHITAIALLITL